MKNKIVKVLVCSWFCTLSAALAAPKPVTADPVAVSHLVLPEVSA